MVARPDFPNSFVGIFWAIQEQGAAVSIEDDRCSMKETEPYGAMPMIGLTGSRIITIGPRAGGDRKGHATCGTDASERVRNSLQVVPCQTILLEHLWILEAIHPASNDTV